MPDCSLPGRGCALHARPRCLHGAPQKEPRTGEFPPAPCNAPGPPSAELLEHLARPGSPPSTAHSAPSTLQQNMDASQTCWLLCKDLIIPFSTTELCTPPILYYFSPGYSACRPVQHGLTATRAGLRQPWLLQSAGSITSGHCRLPQQPSRVSSLSVLHSAWLHPLSGASMLWGHAPCTSAWPPWRRKHTWVAGAGHHRALVQPHSRACVPLLVHEVQVAGPVGQLSGVQGLDVEVGPLDAVLEGLPLAALSLAGLQSNGL